MPITLRVYEINLPNEIFSVFSIGTHNASFFLSRKQQAREKPERRLTNLKRHCWKSKNSKSRKSDGRTQVEGRQANEENDGKSVAKLERGGERQQPSSLTLTESIF